MWGVEIVISPQISMLLVVEAVAFNTKQAIAGWSAMQILGMLILDLLIVWVG